MQAKKKEIVLLKTRIIRGKLKNSNDFRKKLPPKDYRKVDS